VRLRSLIALAALFALAALQWAGQPAAVAQAGCDQYDVTGAWPTHQGNDYDPTFNFSQSGTSVSGTATLPDGQWQRAGYTGNTGQITSGSNAGNHLDVTVTWPPRNDGSVAVGQYTATVTATAQEGQGQLTDGRAGGPGGVSWTGGGPAKCPAAATPTPEPAPGSGSDPCAGASRAHSSAINEVRVASFQPGVEFHRAGSADDSWCPVEKDTVLKQGDEISCDPDGSVTLQFADNSTVVVRNTTQLKIATFFTEGGVVRTEILLKMGEVAAKVNKSEATKSDFVIKEPTATASTRGTAFRVFYDPGSGRGLFSVTEGTLAVRTNASTREYLVHAGHEMLVTKSSPGPIVALGKAGLRGGVSPVKALQRVMKVIARGNGPCRVTVPRERAFAVTAARRGWKVAVKIGGARKGTAKWIVRRSRVTAANRLARAIARRCP
jgi:hypothetical protein